MTVILEKMQVEESAIWGRYSRRAEVVTLIVWEAGSRSGIQITGDTEKSVKEWQAGV